MKTRYQEYEAPKQATYRFLTTNYNGTFSPWSTKVDVLGETEKSYIVRLREPIRDHFVGDKIRVGKKSVDFDEKPEIDTSEFWYNKY